MEGLSRVLDSYAEDFVSGFISGLSGEPVPGCPAPLVTRVTQSVITHLLDMYNTSYLRDYKDECHGVVIQFAPPGEEERWSQLGRVADDAFLSFNDTCWCLEKLKMVEFVAALIPRLFVSFNIEKPLMTTDAPSD